MRSFLLLLVFLMFPVIVTASEAPSYVVCNDLWNEISKTRSELGDIDERIAVWNEEGIGCKSNGLYASNLVGLYLIKLDFKKALAVLESTLKDDLDEGVKDALELMVCLSISLTHG